MLFDLNYHIVETLKKHVKPGWQITELVFTGDHNPFGEVAFTLCNVLWHIDQIINRCCDRPSHQESKEQADKQSNDGDDHYNPDESVSFSNYAGIDSIYVFSEHSIDVIQNPGQAKIQLSIIIVQQLTFTNQQTGLLNTLESLHKLFFNVCESINIVFWLCFIDNLAQIIAD